MPLTILVDGSNIAWISGKPSIEHLIEAIDLIEAIAVGNDGSVRVIIDASLRYRVDSSERARLDELIDSGRIEVAPAKISADRLIVEGADENQGIVISNDQFAQLANMYPWLEKQGSKRFFGAHREPSGRWLFAEKNAGLRAPVFLGEHLSSLKRVSPTSSGVVDLRSSGSERGRYGWPVSRSNPGLVVFLVDQSASMSQEWKGGTRASKLADVLNESIYELIMLSLRSAEDGNAEVRPYFEVAVIGYGRTVRSLLPNTSLNKPLISVVDLAELPRLVSVRKSDGSVDEKTVWFDPVADGATPMIEAIRVTRSIVETWSAGHRGSHPAIVFNITDGEQTDGSWESLRNEVQGLTKIATVDNTLFFSGHISGRGESGPFCPFKTPLEEQPRRVFELTSKLPRPMVEEANRRGFLDVTSDSRGYVYNGAPEQIATLIKVGTPGTPPRTNTGSGN